MTYHFGRFVLDDERRELRLGAREMVLQPRVFDLLLFLVRHRERVVSKQEILDAVWPEVIVADSSVQRAVSLARSTLREGGAGEAIRTHSKIGYRFTVEVREEVSTAGGRALTPRLAQARVAYDHEDWETGSALFNSADGETALEAADLERWAFAAQCAGRSAAAIPPLERAVAAHSAAGDQRGSARAALLLAQIQLELREVPIARGWLRRAERHLEGEDSCRELALCEWTACRLALYEGRLDDAERCGERARRLGQELDDHDLESLGLVYSGHAMVARGRVENGLARVDEAAAAVLAGNVSPWAGGLVYCGVIWLCCNLGDWQRASQWTEHFGRWCERSGVSGFPGLCRLHRAELLSVEGQLESAAREVLDACRVMATGAPWAEGDGFRILGDIRLAQDDLDAAEAAYARCHQLGWDPQPGAALLEAARGRPDAALRSLERSLADNVWAVEQRRGLLLAHKVRLALQAGENDLARAAVAELDRRGDLWSSPSHRAEVEAARGELAMAECRLEDAGVHLRASVRGWCETGFALGLAAARIRLAELHLEEGDQRAAIRELDSSEQALRRLGAQRLLKRCRALQQQALVSAGSEIGCA